MKNKEKALVLSPFGKPGRLDRLGDVRHELSRVYRLGAMGKVEWGDVTRAAWVLVAIGKLIEGIELELRIEMLERTQ